MANTDYRLSTVEGTALFNFNDATTGVGTGMEPHIEDQQLSVEGESTPLSYKNLTQYTKINLTPRNIVLQGELLDDTSNSNQWRLSSAVYKGEIIKLWAGSYWFLYVLGQQCTFRRNEAKTGNVWSYTAVFNAFDPFWYYGNTGGANSGDYDVDPGTQAMDGSGYIDINLSGTGANQGSTYVEPYFILEGGTNTSVSTSQYVQFLDQDGRRIRFTPPVTWSNDVHFIICPYYFRETREGFVPNVCSAYQIVDSGSSPAITAGSEWILDEDCFDNTTFTHASNALITTSVTDTAVDTSATNLNPDWFNGYPRANDGASGGSSGNRITVTSDGTLTDATITAQYLLRRL